MSTPKRSRKTKAVKRKATKPNFRRQVAELEGSINDRLRVIDLERRYLLLERDYDDLKKRLVSLLLPEQIDAARTCGCTPEVYALEWIQLYKEGLRKYAPSFGNSKSIKEITNGSY